MNGRGHVRRANEGRRSVLVCRAGVLLLVAALAALSCGDDPEPVCAPSEAAVASKARFRDVTEEVGIDFIHEAVLGGAFALPEIMGSGVAVFDADGDGDLDLYFVNAGRTRGDGAANRLYLREPDGRYRDATRTSGLGDMGYGMGVAVFDYDADGDLDVYVGNWGRDALYRNDGRGVFADVTQAARVDVDGWTTSIGVLDYDLDGHLDLFVVRYVRFDGSKRCSNADTRPDYCSPRVFRGESDVLLRNRGDGTFEDASERSGVGGRSSNGLGVVVDDFDGDALPDVFVANDGQANHLWRNRGDGTFEEIGLELGVAVNGQGATEASMGVALVDVDGDGDRDLFMTHLVNESNTLYLREGERGFRDGSAAAGLHRPSLSLTGFGTVAFDADHDGDEDLAVVNGRVAQGHPLPRASGDEVWRRYAEPNQLFLNDGRGRFEEADGERSGFGAAVEVSRGLVDADLDGDGDLDLVVTNARGRARIFANVGAAGHWLAVRVDDAAGRAAVPGTVVVVRTAERSLTRVVGVAASYLSSAARPLHFGLGAADEVRGITVHWVGGATETFAGGPVDRAIVVKRGEGR